MTNTKHLSALSDTTPGTSPADPRTTTSDTPSSSPTDHDGSAMPTVRQRDARLLAKTGPARNADLMGAQERVTRFIPGDPQVDPYLSLIQHLARTAEPVNAEDAAELLTALAGHAGYLASVGTPVTEDTLLDPGLVTRWVLHGLAHLTAGTTANYRSRLTRVAAAVHGAPARPAPLYASDPVRPYDRGAEDGLGWWAAALPGALGQDLLVALGLTIGAGLTASQVPVVQGRHITRSFGSTVAVRIPCAKGWTVIPVRARYAKVLLDAAARSGPDEYVFRAAAPGRGGRNGISNLVDAADRQAGGKPEQLERFTPQRARATFIVRHLDAGTRVDMLMQIAGVKNLGAVDRYVRYMSPVGAATELSLTLPDEA